MANLVISVSVGCRGVAENCFQLLPTRVGETRWLAHTKLATTQIIRGYQGFVLHLEQNAASLNISAPEQQLHGVNPCIIFGKRTLSAFWRQWSNYIMRCA
ncbi:hypothetical protein LSAT2_020462 [Lamellibrachia satsuma]|nr:hypothetical protein LSAT2_020462 [Lamellibrachia satsuma]